MCLYHDRQAESTQLVYVLPRMALVEYDVILEKVSCSEKLARRVVVANKTLALCIKAAWRFLVTTQVRPTC